MSGWWGWGLGGRSCGVSGEIEYGVVVSVQVNASTICEKLSPKQRVADMRLTIDHDFVHYCKIQTLSRADGMHYIDRMIHDLPTIPDCERRIRVVHTYTRALGRTRRYCLIDGCDSLGLLTVYNKMSSVPGLSNSSN